jgi:CRP/FNR family cyclic AMP-dependent transcriptional regulator
MIGSVTKKNHRLSERKIADLFANFGWLSQCSAISRQLILGCGELRTFTEGETLFYVGEKPNGLFGMVSGAVSVSAPSDAGSDFAVYQAQPGFWIGDSALFSHQVRIVTVTAVQETTALFLPQNKLKALVEKHPKLIHDFYFLSHRNVAIAVRLLANMAITQSEKRLAAWLLFADEALVAPNRWIEMPHEHIAPMVAMSLPTLRRILRIMVKQGLVDTGYGRLTVLDRDKLRAFAQD